MRFLPVFLDLSSGPILVVGEGDLVQAKLRLLMAAGARVRWHATDGVFDTSTFDQSVVARIEPLLTPPDVTQFNGVIAVLCAGAGELGIAIAEQARASGIPVNVMDDLTHSTFIFPAIVDRGDVIVAVGTGGTSPVVARRVRELIERILPARIGDLATLIGKWRHEIHARIPDFGLRRRFWERVVDGEIGATVLAGRIDDADAAIRAITDPSAFAAPGSGTRQGHVSIVGAGPGDPDLLTIKALRALQDADVIYYDELVTPEILDRARRDAARYPVGRRVGNPGIGQDAINKLLVDGAREGKRVVRLKGGDPFIFGRGGEEVDVLRKAGVAITVVPGITAALGAAAEFELPLTYRQEALRITFLTAHKTGDAEAVDWTALTDDKMTVVVYMGMTAAGAVQDGLLRGGRLPDTPVAVLSRVTRTDSQAVVGRLSELTELVAQIDSGPAILVIGDVVAHSRPWSTATLQTLFSDFTVAAE